MIGFVTWPLFYGETTKPIILVKIRMLQTIVCQSRNNF